MRGMLRSSTTAALAGGVIAPVAGPLGDHIGFRPVLAGALLGAGLSLIAMPEMHSVSALALANVVFAAMSAAITAMIFGLLAAEVRPDRTSTTLNLVYLPLYIAGIVGPATGSFVVEAGLPAVFLMGGAVVAAGAAWVLWELVRTRVSAG